MKLFLSLIIFTVSVTVMAGMPWPIHTIDSSLSGADGARLKDINGDGLPDIACSFEEGNQVRLYLHPGPKRVAFPWPQVTVGRVNGPEDAVFVDLDGNGIEDLVSCTQSKLGEPTNAVFIHRAPQTEERRLDPDAWTTTVIPASRGRQWIYCEPLIDGRTLHLVCGSKNRDGVIGLFQVTGTDPAGWAWQPLRAAGWVMSLVSRDMDGDGDSDILYSDRKGEKAAVGWLENPGQGSALWTDHVIELAPEGIDRMGYHMFLDLADLDGDGLEDVVVAVRKQQIHWLRRVDGTGTAWEKVVIPTPEAAGCLKSVAAGDMDGNGTVDLVFSCEQAEERPGLMWLSRSDSGWKVPDIGGLPGRKFDLVQLVDLDGDGDLDVVTTEERTWDALLWYENPR